MIQMQVPAPQWIQQTPQGLAYAQPAGAAVFTNAIRPNPLEDARTMGGGEWGVLGSEPRTRMFPDFNFEGLYQRFANESVEDFIVRAKQRFHQEIGPVVPEPDEPELEAYYRVWWHWQKAEKQRADHSRRLNNEKYYQDAAVKEHQARMASDAEYAAWVNQMAMSQGESVNAPEIIAQTFAVDPANATIYRPDDFKSLRPARNAVDLMIRRPEPGAMVNPYAPNTSYAPAAAPKNLLDQLTNPLVIGGIIAAGVGLWWLTRKGE